MRSFSISFLVREDCHLCDDARPLVEWAAARSRVGVAEVDIDTDDALVGLYGIRIPVVLGPHGEVLAEGIIQDRKALSEAIRSSVEA